MINISKKCVFIDKNIYRNIYRNREIVNWTELYFQYFTGCVLLLADNHLHPLNLLYLWTLKCWDNTTTIFQTIIYCQAWWRKELLFNKNLAGWCVAASLAQSVSILQRIYLNSGNWFLCGGPSIHGRYILIPGTGKSSSEVPTQWGNVYIVKHLSPSWR